VEQCSLPCVALRSDHLLIGRDLNMFCIHRMSTYGLLADCAGDLCFTDFARSVAVAPLLEAWGSRWETRFRTYIRRLHFVRFPGLQCAPLIFGMLQMWGPTNPTVPHVRHFCR